MRNPVVLLLVILFSTCTTQVFSQIILKVHEGRIDFVSAAPLERIEAGSSTVKGVMNLESGSFAFRASINSFKGFNSPLQQIHFQENYMESDKYPYATFEGKLVDEIPFDRPGEYSVRAKGKFTVHGVKQERIIRGDVFVSENEVRIVTNFRVALVDHEIHVPRIVNQKISEHIDVSIDIRLK